MQLGGEKRPFSYASFVRAKRDLLKEISPEIKEMRDHFQIEGSFGMSLFIMEYPQKPAGDTLSLLKELGCCRVVPARELSLSEMKAIRENGRWHLSTTSWWICVIDIRD